MHTAFGMSLAWVGNWWPLAVIGFGGYLAWKGAQDRREEARGRVDALLDE